MWGMVTHSNCLGIGDWFPVKHEKVNCIKMCEWGWLNDALGMRMFSRQTSGFLSGLDIFTCRLMSRRRMLKIMVCSISKVPWKTKLIRFIHLHYPNWTYQRRGCDIYRRKKGRFHLYFIIPLLSPLPLHLKYIGLLNIHSRHKYYW